MYQRELDAATEIVASVCELTRGLQDRIASTGDAMVKGDRSPVTIADLAAQVVVSRQLIEHFPSDPLLAEEDSSVLAQSTFMTQRVLAHAQTLLPELTVMQLIEALERGNARADSGRCWVLDPIDGTKGFLRGEHYAVALALIEGGRVVVGVLGCPNLTSGDDADPAHRGLLFAAVRGGGAESITLSGRKRRPIAVDPIDDPADAVLCESVEAAHAAHSVQARIAQRLGVRQPPFRIDSQCKYAAVARGDASIYLRLPRDTDYREKVWDHAAGAVIVEEAGGMVTDLEGRPLDFTTGRHLAHGNGIVCSNGLLHQRVLEACRSELSS